MRLTGTRIGDVWLVASRQDVTPDIIASGLPVFGPDQIAAMGCMEPEALAAFLEVKRQSPMATLAPPGIPDDGKLRLLVGFPEAPVEFY